MANYVERGHLLYIDNWYTSPKLAIYLDQQNTGLCGTVKKNRKHFPKFLHRVQRGTCERSSDPPLALFGLSRKEIFLITNEYVTSDSQVIIELLEKSLAEKSGYIITISDDRKPTIFVLLAKFRSKYEETAQRQDSFFKKNESWLNSTVNFPIDAKCATVNKSTGRPAANFEALSDRSKRRRTEEIRTKFSPAELSFTTQMSLRTSGHSDAAKILKDVTLSSPYKATKYKEGLRLSSSLPAFYDANEALTLLLDLKLTKDSYQHLRNQAKAKGLNTLYPPYSAVFAAKKLCYPPDDKLNFTKSKAEKCRI
ncbi:hypothetical protein CBL_08387 [Carabus blaptoides fortunei]